MSVTRSSVLGSGLAARQRGLSLTGLIFFGAIIAFCAVIAIRCLPAWLEYAAVRKHVTELARSGGAASNKDIQSDFDKRADVDDITSVQGRDLEITRTGDNVSISVSYERKVPLFANVSVLFEFDASSGQ